MSEPSIRKIATGDVPVNSRRGGEIRVLLSPKTVGSTSGSLGVASLRPGEHVVEHYHPYSEEFLYLVRGCVVARVDGDQEIELRPGESLMVPKNARHRLMNRGQEPALLVFHASPLAPDPALGHVDTESTGAAAESEARA
jgi:putative monooxygenase